MPQVKMNVGVKKISGCGNKIYSLSITNLNLTVERIKLVGSWNQYKILLTLAAFIKYLMYVKHYSS